MYIVYKKKSYLSNQFYTLSTGKVKWRKLMDRWILHDNKFLNLSHVITFEVFEYKDKSCAITAKTISKNEHDNPLTIWFNTKNRLANKTEAKKVILDIINGEFDIGIGTIVKLLDDDKPVLCYTPDGNTKYWDGPTPPENLTLEKSRKMYQNRKDKFDPFKSSNCHVCGGSNVGEFGTELSGDNYVAYVGCQDCEFLIGDC